MDIKSIPIDQLQKDIQDSYSDISVCEVAISMGITHYSGGLVQTRLDANQHFINVITKELERRKDIIR